jgi:hypothetical protein
MLALSLFFRPLTAAGFQREVIAARSSIEFPMVANRDTWLRVDLPDHELHLISITNLTILNASTFYRIPSSDMLNQMVLYNPGSVAVSYTVLTLPSSTSVVCGSYTIALSTQSFISLNSEMRVPEQDTVCYLFYEPNATFRVIFTCNASSASWCSVWSQESLRSGKEEDVICEHTDSCEITLNDGFIGRSSNDAGHMNDTFTIDYIKGDKPRLPCRYQPIGVVNSSGFFPLNVTWAVTNTCEKPEERYWAALIMVSTLVGGLVCALGIYALCRPSREPTQGDDEDTWKLVPARSVASSRMLGSGMSPFGGRRDVLDEPIVD